jgi:hypothetical protein
MTLVDGDGGLRLKRAAIAPTLQSQVSLPVSFTTSAISVCHPAGPDSATGDEPRGGYTPQRVGTMNPARVPPGHLPGDLTSRTASGSELVGRCTLEREPAGRQ